MPKTFFYGKGGIVRCISQFIHPSKPIKEKYLNCTNSHKFKNLVLIAKAKNTICINSGVSNVYTFLLAYFEDVGFYAARRYVNLTKDRR